MKNHFLYFCSCIIICHAFDKYRWAPISSLKKPYITFLNDFDNPTWSSTNVITRQQTTNQIYLPKNINFFPISCGVCLSNHWKADKLLSQSNIFLQPKDFFNDTQLEIFRFRSGFNKCIILKKIKKEENSNFEKIINNSGKIICKYDKYKIELIYDIVEPKKVFRGISDKIDYDVDDDKYPCPQKFNEEMLLINDQIINDHIVNCTFFNFLNPNVFVHNFQYYKSSGICIKKKSHGVMIFNSFFIIFLHFLITNFLLNNQFSGGLGQSIANGGSMS